MLTELARQAHAIVQHDQDPKKHPIPSLPKCGSVTTVLDALNEHGERCHAIESNQL